MNFLFFIAIVIVVNSQLTEALTVEQMRKFAAPIKKDCMETSNADVSLINGLKDGKLVNNEELKCFLYCVYDSIGTVSTLLRFFVY